MEIAVGFIAGIIVGLLFGILFGGELAYRLTKREFERTGTVT